jgi:uncharacterized protein
VAKFLLFLAVIAVIYALVRASKRRSKPPPATGAPEAMAQCAHCGVHFPVAESVRDAERDYCCEDHRRRGLRS